MARQSENPLWKPFLERRRNLLLERAKMYAAIKKDKKFVDILKVKASKDILFFSDYLCNTFDPRYVDQPSKGIYPFVLFDRQREMLLWLQECQGKSRDKNITGAIVKSRDTGMSWVLCLFLVHSLIFKENFTGILGSRQARLVDEAGNPSTLMAKLDMLIAWLPDWVKPPIYRKSFFIKNELNGSVITGEAGDNLGRGGRSTVVILDEVGFIPRMESVMSALSATTKLVVGLSTPNGRNYFYKMATNPHNEIFKFRWHDDPRKDQRWYDDEVNRLGTTLAEQEYNCNFDATREGQFIPTAWIEACVNSYLHIPEMMECLEDDNIEWQLGLDVSSQGNDQTVLTLRKGVIVTDIWTWSKLDSVASAQKSHQIAEDIKNVNILCFDRDGIGDGVAGAFNLIDTYYEVVPFNGGGKCTGAYIEELEATTDDICLNARAEAWLNLKTRMRKTYEHLTGRNQYPADELISIPDNMSLLTDLTKPEGQRSTTGKLKLMSKQEMKKKGLSSPDFGDSLAYCFWTGVTIGYRDCDW